MQIVKMLAIKYWIANKVKADSDAVSIAEL